MEAKRLQNFRGVINNEEGKCIYDRKGKWENEEQALQALKDRVCLYDGPNLLDSTVMLSNIMTRGLSMSYVYTPLSKFYKDIDKLEYIVIPC